MWCNTDSSVRSPKIIFTNKTWQKDFLNEESIRSATKKYCQWSDGKESGAIVKKLNNGICQQFDFDPSGYEVEATLVECVVLNILNKAERVNEMLKRASSLLVYQVDSSKAKEYEKSYVELYEKHLERILNDIKIYKIDYILKNSIGFMNASACGFKNKIKGSKMFKEGIQIKGYEGSVRLYKRNIKQIFDKFFKKFNKLHDGNTMNDDEDDEDDDDDDIEMIEEKKYHKGKLLMKSFLEDIARKHDEFINNALKTLKNMKQLTDMFNELEDRANLNELTNRTESVMRQINRMEKPAIRGALHDELLANILLPDQQIDIFGKVIKDDDSITNNLSITDKDLLNRIKELIDKLK